jgi:3-hydroxyacyl-CoA dehydrogenase
MPGQMLTLIHARIAVPHFQIQDDVAAVTLNNPPISSLNHALRSHILSALDTAEADQDVRAIILTGGQHAFCADADVEEMGQPPQLAEPVLPTLLARVEACFKPVVMALSGVPFGGGLELAMSCHAHVAFDNAMVGLPEITLGLIPGAGGTQRLSRPVGAAAALALMQSG